MFSMRSNVSLFLSASLTFIIARPGSSFCCCCILILGYTRIRSGFFESKQQRNRDALEKKVPIIPYWFPYLGHTPSLTWSFDDLLARGRDTTSDGIFGLNILGKTHHMVLVPSLVKKYSSSDRRFYLEMTFCTGSRKDILEIKALREEQTSMNSTRCTKLSTL